MKEKPHDLSPLYDDVITEQLNEKYKENMELNLKEYKEKIMGEIADDKISGFNCSYCGVYFEKEHGYPVLCEDCWDNYMGSKKKLKKLGLQKARYKEL